MAIIYQNYSKNKSGTVFLWLTVYLFCILHYDKNDGKDLMLCIQGYSQCVDLFIEESQKVWDISVDGCLKLTLVASECVGFNVPLDTQLVILETRFASEIMRFLAKLAELFI